MINFTKMQGTGNDFIIINNVQRKITYDYDKLSEYLCNRHFGIGADGVIFVEESSIADYKMRIFNSDGSEAEMCGNGIRCFSKYLYKKELIKNPELSIETLAGVKNASLILEGNKVAYVKVNMESPILEYKKIPVIEPENNKNNYLEIDDKKLYPISMGNPHCVCFVDNVNNINIEKEGAKIENYKYFPNKTNVEFVEIVNDKEIKLRVWERGVGETLSCGTGACAGAFISHKEKNMKNKLKVNLKGGNLDIEYNLKEDSIYLIGEAEEIFYGNIEI